MRHRLTQYELHVVSGNVAGQTAVLLPSYKHLVVNSSRSILERCLSKPGVCSAIVCHSFRCTTSFRRTTSTHSLAFPPVSARPRMPRRCRSSAAGCDKATREGADGVGDSMASRTRYLPNSCRKSITELALLTHCLSAVLHLKCITGVRIPKSLISSAAYRFHSPNGVVKLASTEYASISTALEGHQTSPLRALNDVTMPGLLPEG